MPVMNWLSSMRSPDVSERDAKLYQDARQGQADYLAKLAGVKKTGAETRGIGIRNQGEQLALDQQKALNGLFAKHFNPETQQLDPVGFTKDATASGILSPSAIQTPMATTAGALETGAKAAESGFKIGMYGGDTQKLVPKPSMAPAAPTTAGGAPKEAQGFQGFANTLGGIKPVETYDPTQAVKEQATILEGVKGEKGNLARTGIVGAATGFDQLLQKEAQRFLGVPPQKEYFGGDIGKFQAAQMEYANKIASLPAHLQEFSRAVVPGGLATASGIQAKEQSAKDFGFRGKLTGWEDAGVPDRAMPEAVATGAKKDLANVRTLESVLGQLGKGAASDDAIQKTAEGLVRLKESGKVDAASILGLNPSLGRAVAEEGFRKGGVKWVASQIRGNQRQAAGLIGEYVANAKTAIKETVKANASGVDFKKLDAYIDGPKKSDELKTFTDPKDPEFIALPKGTRFKGPNGKVRIK